MVLKRIEIAHIDPLMLGKVNAIFGFVMGLLMGVLTLLSSGIIAGYLQTLSGTPSDLIEKTQQLGFFGLLFFLFLGIVTGFISGALIAVVYNAVVKMVGGLKVEVNEE
jgi:hypothetical protein